MRRCLKRTIPAFAIALALLVQLLSPIGAVRFVAAAAADPFTAVHLCSAMASPDGSPASAPGLPHDGGCCAICAMGLGGAPTPVATPFAFTTLARSYQPMVWSHRDGAPPLQRWTAATQPRAPPAA